MPSLFFQVRRRLPAWVCFTASVFDAIGSATVLFTWVDAFVYAFLSLSLLLHFFLVPVAL